MTLGICAILAFLYSSISLLDCFIECSNGWRIIKKDNSYYIQEKSFLNFWYTITIVPTSKIAIKELSKIISKYQKRFDKRKIKTIEYS